MEETMKKTGPGNLEFKNTIYSFGNLEATDKVAISEMIRLRGGSVEPVGQRTSYLISAFEEGSADLPGTAYLLSSELFYAWTDPLYRIANRKFETRLELGLHYLKHRQDWERDSFGRCGQIEAFLAEEAERIASVLAEKEEGKEDETLFWEWIYAEHEGIFTKNGQEERIINTDALSLKAAAAFMVFFFEHAEDLTDKVRTDIKEYFNKNIHPFMRKLCELEDTKTMQIYLEYLFREEKNWLQSGYSDGFYLYSMINEYLEKMISEEKTQITTLLLSFREDHYDEDFKEAAESNEMDMEFGFKVRPAVYYSKGAKILFGRYPMEGQEDAYPESLEWEVLDSYEDRALIITKKAIDPLAYDHDFRAVCWENSSLRKWLNGDFLDKTFSQDEADKILETENSNPANPKYNTGAGEKTVDRIFLLSMDEAGRYYPDDFSRKKEVTAYAKVRGANLAAVKPPVANTALTNDPGENVAAGITLTARANAVKAYNEKMKAEEGNFGRWLLRTSGSTPYNVSCVDIDGSIDEIGHFVYYERCCIAPALWLDISMEEF